MLVILVKSHTNYRSKGHSKSCWLTVIIIVNVILLMDKYRSNYHTNLMVLDRVENRKILE